MLLPKCASANSKEAQPALEPWIEANLAARANYSLVAARILRK